MTSQHDSTLSSSSGGAGNEAHADGSSTDVSLVKEPSARDGTPTSDTAQADALRPSWGRVQIGWHAILAVAAAIFLGMGLLGLIRFLARPLAILVLGVAIAAALAAPVAWLQRRMPRMAAIILVHFVILLLFAGFVALAIPPLVTQVEELNQGFPESINWINERLNQMGLRDLRPLLGSVTPSMQGIGGQLMQLPLRVTDVLLTVLVIFFLSIYGLMAAPDLRKFLVSLAPERYSENVDHVLTDMMEGMGGYVRGVFITGTFVGVLTYIGLRIIGLPYPLVLGVFAGVMEVIPVIGTTISLVTITGVGLLDSVTTALITFAFMVGLQLLEGNILFPNIVGRQTNSSPLLSMFAFFAGMSVGGIIGGIIGVPVAAALRVLVVEVAAPALRAWTGAEADAQSTSES